MNEFVLMPLERNIRIQGECFQVDDPFKVEEELFNRLLPSKFTSEETKNCKQQKNCLLSRKIQQENVNNNEI